MNENGEQYMIVYVKVKYDKKENVRNLDDIRKNNYFNNFRIRGSGGYFGEIWEIRIPVHRGVT